MICWYNDDTCYDWQEDVPTREVELKELKDSLQDTQPVGAIVNCCKTLDQVRRVKIYMFHMCMQYFEIAPFVLTYTKKGGMGSTLNLLYPHPWLCLCNCDKFFLLGEGTLEVYRCDIWKDPQEHCDDDRCQGAGKVCCPGTGPCNIRRIWVHLTYSYSNL